MAAKPASRDLLRVREAALEIKSAVPEGCATVNVAGRDMFVTRKDSASWEIVKRLGTFKSNVLFVDLEPEVFAVLWRYISTKSIIDPKIYDLQLSTSEIVESLLDGGIRDINMPVATGYTALWCPLCTNNLPIIIFYDNSATLNKINQAVWDESKQTVKCIDHKKVWKVTFSPDGSKPLIETLIGRKQVVTLWKPKVSSIEQARGRAVFYAIYKLLNDSQLPEFMDFKNYFY